MREVYDAEPSKGPRGVRDQRQDRTRDHLRTSHILEIGGDLKAHEVARHQLAADHEVVGVLHEVRLEERNAAGCDRCVTRGRHPRARRDGPRNRERDSERRRSADPPDPGARHWTCGPAR